MIEIAKKQWFVILVALIFIVFAVFCVYDTNKGKLPGKTKDGKDVVAAMKDYSLTADDLYEDLYDKYQGVDTLYKQFQNLVVDQAVKTTDEIKKDAEAAKENLINQAKNQASSGSSTGQGTTDYNQIIANQLVYYGFAADDLDGYGLIAAKSQKLSSDYIDAHLDELFSPIYKEKNSRTVSHILIKVEDVDKLTKEEKKKMEDVDKALKDGKTFAEVAKQYSDDTGSKDSGGSLGYMDSDTTFVESFKKQALDMKAGQVSGWVKESNSNYKGYHKIMVHETDKDALEKDKEIRTSLYQTILQNNQNLAFTYIWEAAKKLDIKFGNDEVKKQLLDYMGVKE